MTFDNANPQFKDSLFRDFFNDPVRLLDLCNSLLHSNYSDIDDIEINTLEANFFSGLKNDISCKLDNHFLVLVEHQSTVNENMPFRFLSYISELLNNLVKDKKIIYRKGLISLPAPNFFVFYDGNDESEPVNRIMRLSDSFNGFSSSLELIVHSININLNKQADILHRCHYLLDYSTLIAYVKLNLAEGLSRRNAIIYAIDRCISENVMCDYLSKKKDEVFSMLDFQWNLDDAKAAWQDEARNEAFESVALNMLKDGLPVDHILPLDQIQVLAQSLSH